jgi:hypothetical protein
MLLKIVGAVSIPTLSFVLTLQILHYLDESAAERSANALPSTFADVVSALKAGKPAFVQFDDNPAETRDESGRIACGPDAGKGYLGVLIAGRRYEIKYSPVGRAWTTSGPYQSTDNCKNYTTTTNESELGPTKVRLEDGDLVLWGAIMTFDNNLDVFDSAKRRVGHVSIGR